MSGEICEELFGLYRAYVTGVILILCGWLMLAASVLILRRRVELGTHVALWSPFVRRRAQSGRLTAARLGQTGTYLAISYAAFALICGAGLVIGGVARLA